MLRKGHFLLFFAPRILQISVHSAWMSGASLRAARLSRYRVLPQQKGTSEKEIQLQFLFPELLKCSHSHTPILTWLSSTVHNSAVQTALWGITGLQGSKSPSDFSKLVPGERHRSWGKYAHGLGHYIVRLGCWLRNTWLPSHLTLAGFREE